MINFLLYVKKILKMKIINFEEISFNYKNFSKFHEVMME